jgi:cellulose synthase/poly-beta-1,6-N-acetylglucosamine synthase-like glycosyltransferase
VLREFNLYDLFILSFVQLVLATVLVLSPARHIRTRFRWMGSKITEVLLGALGAVAITALACVLSVELWGLSVSGVETAAYLLVIFSLGVIILRSDCGFLGQVFHASYLAAGFTFLGFAGYVASAATHSIPEAITSSFLLLLDLGAFLVWGSNVSYISDVLCRTRHSRPQPVADPGYQPMVSLHIPAYNEPPEILINTIKAAEQLDYPDFEVVVIDNNTSDPMIYGPVEEYCRDRERVRFVHVAPWPGYKAGACNLALRSYTDPRAEIVGLIDADDIVQPHYLRETVSYFSDPQLGFIQTFEGNRDYEGSAYYTACVDSYQAFYMAIMSSRNERNSIPFVGTMGLFRRSALVGIGGWNEWCISEDTEASVRMSKAGWDGLYIPRCFGRGVVPPTYAGLNTQRHRWCFGAMQIFRLHWRSLMPWDRSADNHLSSSQRRDYLMGCMGWTRDLMMFGFALLLLAIAGLRITGSHFAITPLAGDRSLLPMSLILIATICMMWTLRYWTTMSHRRALLCLVISLSAGWITALACIEGMARKDGVFLRTSKSGSTHHRIRTALRLSRLETLLSGALYSSAGLLATLSHPPLLLIFIMSLQGTVYLCAPIASLWNLRAQRVPVLTYRRRFEERRLRQARRRWPLSRVLGPVTATLLALGVGGVTSAFVAPAALLRATVVHHKAISVQALLSSSSDTEVYIKLAPASSKQAAYYPVSSVSLSKPVSSSPVSPVALGLSFETSTLALLDAVIRDDSPGKGISALTLVIRKSGKAGRPGTTEVTDTFYKALVASFVESLSGSPAGNVTLSLSSLGHVLTAPKAFANLGPFPEAPLSSPPSTTDAYVSLGPTSSEHRSYYPVTLVELSQSVSSSPTAPVQLNLSFETSSLVVLDEVLRDGGPGRAISGLTLVVGKSGPNGRPTTVELTDTFRKALVSSFDETLSGAPVGKVTLSLK